MENKSTFDPMEPRARVMTPPPGGSRVREYAVSGQGMKGVERVLATSPKEAARLFVESTTWLLQIAEEVGSVEVGVSGGDADGCEFWRVRAVQLQFCISERAT